MVPVVGGTSASPIRAESSAERAAREQADLIREQNRLLAEQNRLLAGKDDDEPKTLDDLLEALKAEVEQERRNRRR
jgi:hypothetical protein